MESKIANRLDQLLQYLRWFETGKMERWQVEDYFKELLDIVDGENE